MSRVGQRKWRSTVLGIGLSVIAAPASFGQQTAPPVSSAPSPQGSAVGQPVIRVSKNEAIPSASPMPVAAPHPLDPALDLARQSLGLMQSQITDYTAVLVKRERIGDELGDNEFMFVKIRNRKMQNNEVVVPFSVYLAFLKPATVKGREVLFIENQNEGKLFAHEGGMKRMLGTHLLEPTGYLAMAGQKYPLTDIGLENLVVKLIEKGERDRTYGHCQVELLPGAKVGGRTCSILQVTHPEEKPHYEFHIAQVFMDDEWKIPVRYAAFGWPSKPGADPEVIEEYTYQNIKINVGLTDKDFDLANSDYNFHKR
jgi:hypothetical protein